MGLDDHKITTCTGIVGVPGMGDFRMSLSDAPDYM